MDRSMRQGRLSFINNDEKQSIEKKFQNQNYSAHSACFLSRWAFHMIALIIWSQFKMRCSWNGFSSVRLESFGMAAGQVTTIGACSPFTGWISKPQGHCRQVMHHLKQTHFEHMCCFRACTVSGIHVVNGCSDLLDEPTRFQAAEQQCTRYLCSHLECLVNTLGVRQAKRARVEQ